MSELTLDLPPTSPLLLLDFRMGKRPCFADYTGEKLTQALIASCSMPFMMDPAPTPDGLCLDGGIADSIPFDVAQEQGYDKIVVVRTRDVSYRKKPSSRPV